MNAQMKPLEITIPIIFYNNCFTIVYQSLKLELNSFNSNY